MKPKYELGKEVWYLRDNRVFANKIIGYKEADNLLPEEFPINFEYFFRVEGAPLIGAFSGVTRQYESEKISEHFIFSSKEELLKSL